MGDPFGDDEVFGTVVWVVVGEGGDRGWCRGGKAQSVESVVEEGEAGVVAPGCSCDENAFGDPLELAGFETSR